MNNSSYNEVMPPPPPEKVNGIEQYVEKQPVYFAKVSRTTHNRLKLYKIESKYKNTTNPYHKDYSYHKIKTGIPEDKDYIIGVYQREGLNSAHLLKHNELNSHRSANGITVSDFVLDPDKWYNFINTGEQLTIREFESKPNDKLNIFYLMYAETKLDDYDVSLNNYIYPPPPHPFYDAFYARFMINPSWKTRDIKDFPPRGFWGYVRIRTKLYITNDPHTRMVSNSADGI